MIFEEIRDWAAFHHEDWTGQAIHLEKQLLN